MDSVYFYLFSFLVEGWCHPVHYESTDPTEMDFVPVTLEDSMNDPWSFDEYTSEGRYKEQVNFLNFSTYPQLFTLFSTPEERGGEEETQMSVATRTTTETLATRIIRETEATSTSTNSTLTVKEENTVLNETTSSLGDLQSLTEDREGMIVLRKVAQIMVLLGDRVIPHIIQQLAGYETKCKENVNFEN